VVPTTSHPSRRSSRSKNGSSITQGAPLKSIRLTVTLAGEGRALLERLAAEKGLTVEEKGGDLSIAFAAAASPEDALAQLRLLTRLLAPKG
jgi:hypothetical protein